MAHARQFPAGPWSSEPDHAEWEHAGFRCAIQRVPGVGHLCGYVGVPPGHPWHGKDYDRIDAQAHGGLTFADRGAAGIKDSGLWWVGFDCAHLGDMMPVNANRVRSSASHDTYRNIAFVTEETNRLAEQAARAKEGA